AVIVAVARTAATAAVTHRRRWYLLVLIRTLIDEPFVPFVVAVETSRFPWVSRATYSTTSGRRHIVRSGGSDGSLRRMGRTRAGVTAAGDHCVGASCDGAATANAQSVMVMLRLVGQARSRDNSRSPTAKSRPCEVSHRNHH